jgi:hypothetical protein
MRASLRNLRIRRRSATCLRPCSLASILAVAKDLRSSRLLVWVFNVEGSVDLIAAIALATIYGAAAYMGPAYWIPAFWVPALLVTHYITFVILAKYWTGSASHRNTATPLNRP